MQDRTSSGWGRDSDTGMKRTKIESKNNEELEIVYILHVPYCLFLVGELKCRRLCRTDPEELFNLREGPVKDMPDAVSKTFC
jgi:hypothetical protein